MTTADLRIAEASVGERRRDQATSPRRRSSHRDHFPRKLVHLCSLIERDRVIRGANAEPSGFAERRIRHAREDGFAHFTSARQLLPALFLNPFCE